MRLTVDEYCKKFKMSKEMINSKLKMKRLNYIIEDGITYIIVTNNAVNTIKQTAEQVKTPQKPKAKETGKVLKPKTTVATILALYQRENQQLKEKILQLESKIDKLIDDKEQMLRDEMQKIEEVYSAKDEQLKTILELVNKKLTMDNSTQEIHDIQTIENKEDTQEDEDSGLVEIKTYLKTLDLKSYQKKIIKKRFLAVHNSDIRILQQNGKLYLDFSKYDYSDLLEY